jgi:uncharacterized protein
VAKTGKATSPNVANLASRPKVSTRLSVAGVASVANQPMPVTRSKAASVASLRKRTKAKPTKVATGTGVAKRAKRETLSLGEARRIALVAQGFGEPRPTGAVERRHIRKVFDRIGVLQVDSVNVLARSEELPIFARLGPHPRNLVRDMEADGELFEYWAHEASLLPIAHEPLFRWKKEQVRAGTYKVWPGMAKMRTEKPEFLARVLEEVTARGPIAASELSMRVGQVGGHWGWRWDDAKAGIETLFWGGELAGRRRPNFEREYEIPSQRFPAHILAQPAPDEHTARLELLRIAARCMGIGTAKELADYHRLNIPAARPLIAELVALGDLVEVAVDGWGDNLLLHPEAKVPRRVEARALLSPFDSLIWERTRTEQLFGMRYRIEIYVPQPKRVHGYYVLPFLLGDELVARVDLKADRHAGQLLVQAAWGELGIDETHVAAELGEELAVMAEWLGLSEVVVKPKGDLHRALAKATKAAKPAKATKATKPTRPAKPTKATRPAKK